jgi:two-component system cell cycle sensor histidine kinase/response regulator CckA
MNPSTFSPTDASSRLHALLEAMQDIVLVLDAEGRYVEIAPTRHDLLYCPPNDIIGKTPYDLFPRKEADLFHNAFQQACQSHRVVTIAYSLAIGNRDLWFEARLSPVYDAQGQVASVLAVIRDITLHRQAREALRESEAQYRTLVEQSNAGIYLLFDRRFVFANQRFLEMFGVSYEDIHDPSFDFTTLVAPQSIALIEERERKVAAGETVPLRYEFTALTRDGREIVVEASVAYLPYQGGIATQGVVQDITDRKQAEVALQESEERYRRLIELMPDGVAVHQEGVIRMVNAAAVRTLGYDSPDQVIGQPILSFVHPHDRATVMQRVRVQLERGEVAPPREERFLRRGGGTVLVEAAGAPFSLGGKPAVLVVVRDITDRRRLEEQLRQAQKMEAIGRLAGGIAHDFNNLLTAINGYADLLLQMLHEHDPARREVEAILKAGRRAAGLTQQLLAFSRKQVLEMRVLNPSALLEDLAKMLQRIIGEDIDLVVVPNPQVGNVRVDPAQMEQIIVNLAVNARDAMPQGGRLTIEMANVELDATYAQDHAEVLPGSYVCLAVTDTGAGMPPDILSHLFEPFFTTKEAGTGLGLATVYGIVKQFEGYIQVYSEVTEGTSFKIYLPRVHEPATALEPSSRPESWPRGTETVLVVEDNDMVRNLAIRILVAQGYNVLEASRGTVALGTVRTYAGAIDLLLTDVVMPEMSGRTLMERIREIRPGLRVLYMSGYTDNVIAHHGVLEPGTPFLPKPFTPQVLAQKVRAVLDG